MKRAPGAAFLSLLVVGSPAFGQWERVRNESFPRTANGEPDLTAPAPRSADGEPDLSGVWLTDSDPAPEGIQTVEGDLPFPRHMIDIAADLKPEEVQLLPWAAELFDRRRKEGTEAPIAYCKPTGVPWLTAIPLPYKIVQTSDWIGILYEENTVFRQIFLDGREPVDDPLPRWMGYSTGSWEGEELLVETTGLTEESWIDGIGHPHSASMRVLERFRRPDAGHLEIEITIDDPGAYAHPITYALTATATPDDDLLEYFCTENEKSSAHYYQEPGPAQ